MKSVKPHARKLGKICRFLLGATLLTPVAAYAQADAPAQGDQAAEDGLEVITVTAQRRSENLQRAAIAITAVSGDSLARSGVTDTAQLTRIAPALQIGSLSGSSAQLYLRGVGNFTSNTLSDAALSINLDGVPIARSGAVQGIFYDLERVEVLKGPQGTLYGRNATGGAINVITAKPRAGEFSGYLNGEYGNFDAVKVSGAVNVPAGENGAFRVAGILSDHDGYYSDGTGDEKMRAIRVQALAKLTDTFKLTVGGDVAHMGGMGSGATVHGLNPDDRIGTFDPRAGAVFSQTLAPAAGTFLSPVTGPSYSDNLYWGMYAQADIETPIGNLTVLPAFRAAQINNRSTVAATLEDHTTADQASLEIRLASSDSGRLSYLIGGFILDENILQRFGVGAQYFNAHDVTRSDTTSYAGFGRLTYKVTDSFRLTGGLRYTIDKKSADLNSYQLVVTCLPFIFTGTFCPNTPPLPAQLEVPSQFLDASGNPVQNVPYGTGGATVNNTHILGNPSRTFKKATYRLGFEYDAGPQSLIYGTFETGFKAGGFFNTFDRNRASFNPETISAFTLGSKNRFMNNRLQLNIEAFWWTYKDQQVSHFRNNSLGVPEFVTENIGKTRIRGVEIEGRALVGLGTTLNASVQYLDAKTLNFSYQNPINSGPPNTGCPFAPGLDASGAPVFQVNCSNRRAVNAPEWTINAGIEQVLELGNGGKFVFNADGRYQSSSSTGFEQLSTQLQKGYFMLDLQVQYAFPGSQLTIAGFANNVTDKNVVGFSIPHPFGPSLIVDSLRPPRTYGVRVGYKF